MTNPQAFAKVLEYIYTKDLNVVNHTMDKDFLIAVFELAGLYDMEPLKYKLELLMLTWQLTKTNVCYLMILADQHRANKVRSVFAHQ